MIFPIKEIVHPSDFSALSKKAFVHALRLALNAHCKLTVIHFSEPETTDERAVIDEELSYEFLDRILSRWRTSKALNLELASAATRGFQIQHVALRGRELVDALAQHINRHHSQLIVTGTHGRTGIEQLRKRSCAETLFHRTDVSSLFISPRTRGFVDPNTGKVRLRRVLLPVDYSPAPQRAIHITRELGRLLIGREPRVDFVHIGRQKMGFVDLDVGQSQVISRDGFDAAKGIVDAAAELVPDMICMATAGHHGWLDVLRGSTTQRVLRAAPCPILAIAAKI